MMSQPQPNGLGSLSAQRERARRSMPPPRHPLKTTVSLPESTATPDAPPPDEETTPTAPLAPAATTKPPSGPILAPEKTRAPFKVTLYVDRDLDEFMEAARVEGLTSRPKVDVSRSAVVRLALRRLMEHMSPAEVKAHLEGQVVRSAGPGRKRR